MRSFQDVLDCEIRNALPFNWKMVAVDKLLGKSPCKIGYAFTSKIINGKSKLINILILDSNISIDEQLSEQIVSLRNYIISKDCILIVICEQQTTGVDDEIIGFVIETLDISSPNYLSIACYRDMEYKTTIDGVNYEDINVVIHDIWSGDLKFSGPKTGTQFVNLEVMKDECWKCGKHMKTVTGIAFPNKDLDNWTNRDWLYYNQLVSLSALATKHAQVVKDFVDKIRITDELITPVNYRYSNTIKSKYWASACPHCKSLRGDFHVINYRTQYLHDLKSRINCSLQYYVLELNVDNELIEILGSGYEYSPHSCLMGWERN